MKKVVRQSHITSVQSAQDRVEEKNLLKDLSKNQKLWGLDLYEAEQNTDLLGSLQNHHFQALEIIDYLEDYVVPFLDGCACEEEKKSLKRWIFKTRGRVEKSRRGQLSNDLKPLADDFDFDPED